MYRPARRGHPLDGQAGQVRNQDSESLKIARRHDHKSRDQDTTRHAGHVRHDNCARATKTWPLTVPVIEAALYPLRLPCLRLGREPRPPLDWDRIGVVFQSLVEGFWMRGKVDPESARLGTLHELTTLGPGYDGFTQAMLTDLARRLAVNCWPTTRARREAALESWSPKSLND